MLKQKLTMAVAALVLGSSAWAGGSADSHTQPVQYTRGDLTSEQGASVLYARLDTAARAVCGTKSRVLTELAQWQRCHDEALDRAVAEVNDTRLSALHKGAPRLVASR